MAECAPCPCDPVCATAPNFALRGFLATSRSCSTRWSSFGFCGRHRPGGGAMRRRVPPPSTASFRLVCSVSRRWRHACSAGARTLRRACRRDRDAAGRGERRARRFMGYAGPSSGTEERLIIANAVDCMRTLRARACTRQRPEGTPRPTLQPLFAAPPLHSCSSLERSLPACPCAADDAIVIDCMVKGVIPPDCKSER